MRRLTLTIAALLVLSCGRRTPSAAPGSYSRNGLFPPADSLTGEVAAFIDGYADAFVRDLSGPREARRENLFSALRGTGMSRYGSSETLDAFAGALSVMADSTSALIGRQLRGRAGDAFKEERGTYARWRDYYRDSTSLAVLALWTVSSGGTAWGAWQAANAYDLADMNYSDLMTVLATLQGREAPSAPSCAVPVSITMLDGWRETQCGRSRAAVQAFTDPDGVVRIPEGTGVGADELDAVCGILSRETALFKEWLASREEFFRAVGATDSEEMAGRAVGDRLRLTSGL